MLPSPTRCSTSSDTLRADHRARTVTPRRCSQRLLATCSRRFTSHARPTSRQHRPSVLRSPRSTTARLASSPASHCRLSLLTRQTKTIRQHSSGSPILLTSLWRSHAPCFRVRKSSLLLLLVLETTTMTMRKTKKTRRPLASLQRSSSGSRSRVLYAETSKDHRRAPRHAAASPTRPSATCHGTIPSRNNWHAEPCRPSRHATRRPPSPSRHLPTLCPRLRIALAARHGAPRSMPQSLCASPPTRMQI